MTVFQVRKLRIGRHLYSDFARNPALAGQPFIFPQTPGSKIFELGRRTGTKVFGTCKYPHFTGGTPAFATT
jgi:hypothetical protein